MKREKEGPIQVLGQAIDFICFVASQDSCKLGDGQRGGGNDVAVLLNLHACVVPASLEQYQPRRRKRKGRRGLSLHKTGRSTKVKKAGRDGRASEPGDISKEAFRTTISEIQVATTTPPHPIIGDASTRLRTRREACDKKKKKNHNKSEKYKLQMAMLD
jgi:hypothetical protein